MVLVMTMAMRMLERHWTGVHIEVLDAELRLQRAPPPRA
jgi:hypothetical protein